MVMLLVGVRAVVIVIMMVMLLFFGLLANDVNDFVCPIYNEDLQNLTFGSTDACGCAFYSFCLLLMSFFSHFTTCFDGALLHCHSFHSYFFRAFKSSERVLVTLITLHCILY